MQEGQVLEILGSVRAVLTGHFVYTSGLHGSAYINKDALYLYPAKTSLLCRALIKRFANDDLEAIVVPAVGGVAISQWTAYHLSEALGRDVLAIYADKTIINGEDEFLLKRGYDKLIPDKRIGVMEDLLTTGKSARKVVEAVRRCRGNVVGVGVFCNRGGVTAAQLGDVPKLEALANVKMETWKAGECPLCARGVPVNTDVGHGREFLALQYAR